MSYKIRLYCILFIAGLLFYNPLFSYRKKAVPVAAYIKGFAIGTLIIGGAMDSIVIGTFYMVGGWNLIKDMCQDAQFRFFVAFFLIGYSKLLGIVTAVKCYNNTFENRYNQAVDLVELRKVFSFIAQHADCIKKIEQLFAYSSYSLADSFDYLSDVSKRIIVVQNHLEELEKKNDIPEAQIQDAQTITGELSAMTTEVSHILSCIINDARFYRQKIEKNINNRRSAGAPFGSYAQEKFTHCLTTYFKDWMPCNY